MRNSIRSRDKAIPIILAFVLLLPWAIVAEDTTTARLAVSVQAPGQPVRRARARDSVSPNDQLQVHVKPTRAAHVYVVRSDFSRATLVAEARLNANQLWSHPQANHITAGDTNFSITFVVSDRPRPELRARFAGGFMPHHEWTAVEAELMHESKVDLGESGENPTSVAANVRSMPGEIEALLVPYSGIGLVVQRYFFQPH